MFYTQWLSNRTQGSRSANNVIEETKQASHSKGPSRMKSCIDSPETHTTPIEMPQPRKISVRRIEIFVKNSDCIHERISIIVIILIPIPIRIKRFGFLTNRYISNTICS